MIGSVEVGINLSKLLIKSENNPGWDQKSGVMTGFQPNFNESLESFYQHCIFNSCILGSICILKQLQLICHLIMFF